MRNNLVDNDPEPWLAESSSGLAVPATARPRTGETMAGPRKERGSAMVGARSLFGLSRLIDRTPANTIVSSLI